MVKRILFGNFWLTYKRIVYVKHFNYLHYCFESAAQAELFVSIIISLKFNSLFV